MRTVVGIVIALPMCYWVHAVAKEKTGNPWPWTIGTLLIWPFFSATAGIRFKRRGLAALGILGLAYLSILTGYLFAMWDKLADSTGNVDPANLVARALWVFGCALALSISIAVANRWPRASGWLCVLFGFELLNSVFVRLQLLRGPNPATWPYDVVSYGHLLISYGLAIACPLLAAFSSRPLPSNHRAVGASEGGSFNGDAAGESVEGSA